MVYAITRSCSKGELLDCACDPTKKGKGDDEQGTFDWGGCSDNIKFALDFARRFVDAPEKMERDPRALMNLHNNAAGRRVSTYRLEIRTNAFVMGFSWGGGSTSPSLYLYYGSHWLSFTIHSKSNFNPTGSLLWWTKVH